MKGEVKSKIEGGMDKLVCPWVRVRGYFQVKIRNV